MIAQLLPWILPPVLGAIIGYVTNAIAIRMLFRPFNEIRVLGLRLPFTPGLIPRERGQLAKSMGRMVSTELLTDTALKIQIRTPSFRTAMEQNVSGLTSQVLGMRLADVEASMFRERPAGENGFSSFGALLSAAFSGFSRSGSFRLLGRAFVTQAVDSIASRPAKDLLRGDGVFAGMFGRLLESLSSDRSRAEIRRAVSTWVERELAANKALSRYVTADDGEALAGLLERVYPALAALVVKSLRSEGMRRELAVRGRFLVQDIVDRLTGLQRLIISAAQYQRTLDENMDKIIDDTLDAFEDGLFDPDTKGRVVESLRRELGAARERGVGDLAGEHRVAVAEAAAGIAERVVGALAGSELRDGLAGFFDGGDESTTLARILSRLFDMNGKTPGQFAADLLLPVTAPDAGDPGAGAGPTMMAEAPGGAAAKIAAAAPEMEGTSVGSISGIVERSVRDFLSSRGETTIAELLGMDDATKASFDLALASTLIATIETRAAEIIASVNVQELVVSKIDGLNIEEVEGLLLQLIQKHLQYINLFGGILGALIGFIQDLARLLHIS